MSRQAERSHSDVLSDLIAHYGSAPRCAEALGEDTTRIKSWRARDSIPGPVYVTVAAACAKIGLRDTVETLATYANRKRRDQDNLRLAS